MAREKLRFRIANFFRKSTPIPADREVYQMGIQERHQSFDDDWSYSLSCCR